MRANATTSDQRCAAFNNIFGTSAPPSRVPGLQSRSGNHPGQQSPRPIHSSGYSDYFDMSSLNHPAQHQLHRPPPLTNQRHHDSQYMPQHYQQSSTSHQRPQQWPANGSDGYRNPPPMRVHDFPSSASSNAVSQYKGNHNHHYQRTYPPPAYSSRAGPVVDSPVPSLNSDSYRARSLQSTPQSYRSVSTFSSWSQVQQERSHSLSSASDSRSESTSREPPKRQFSSVTTSSNLSGISEADRTYSLSSIASTNTMTAQSRQRRPAVTYPALLSLVSEAFRVRISLSDKQKDGLTYKAAFSGSEAVDMIMQLIKTTDRNLALLLGRSLDAQKFFHDVTYEHRLRDRPDEIYQFRERLNSPSFENPSDLTDGISSPSRLSGDADDLPNGVFTLLTECYSPTCTRDRLCYSIACPRRLEQQARLNMKPTGLKRPDSRASLKEDEGEQKLWIHTVPKEIAELTSDKEKKRQEVICEVSYTERDFVKDLEYLRDFWIKPLRTQSTIPDSYRDKFIKTVFSNILEVHSVNSRLAEALTRRQQREPVVSKIGDIFLEYIPRFEPFIKYGANQLWGKYEFEKEKSSNPSFAKFTEETERLKESRKLELNGYLTKPTTRLARYPLLLEAVLKATEEDNSDHQDIPKAIELIRHFLARVNEESGKSENLLNLMQLEERLCFKQGEHIDLKLSDPNRQMLHKGMLKKRESASDTRSDTVQVFLFDHALLIVKVKVVNKREQYKVTRKKPIPLELLVVSTAEEPRGSLTKRPSSSLLPGTSKNGKPETTKTETGKTGGYSIVFTHLGRRGYMITLYAGTFVNRKKWMETISSQQKLLVERSRVFDSVITCEKYFMGGNRVNCLVPFDGGRKLAYGTDTGIYVSDRKPHSTTKSTPVRTLTLSNVVQMDILEEYGLILVLSDKSLLSFPLEALDPNDQTLANKRPRKIAGHLNFFKVGVCLGRFLVCVVKSSVLSSTVKVFEPVNHVLKGKKQPAFRKLLQGGTEMLKVFKVLASFPIMLSSQEFYIPTESSSIHFLKTKLCVGCAKGFEVVSLENLETQSLLDPADTSLDFVQRRENVKPIAIYRMNGEFLVCYDEFAFFVNKNGWRARSDWIIYWEGMPSSFAFEPSFIEIHHLETGALSQVIPGNNIILLSDGRGKLGEGGEILYGCENSEGENQVHALMRHS